MNASINITYGIVSLGLIAGIVAAYVVMGNNLEASTTVAEKKKNINIIIGVNVAVIVLLAIVTWGLFQSKPQYEKLYMYAMLHMGFLFSVLSFATTSFQKIDTMVDTAMESSGSTDGTAAIEGGTSASDTAGNLAGNPTCPPVDSGSSTNTVLVLSVIGVASAAGFFYYFKTK